uniref:Uncharacterized protein n=1 Tax=Physcomitrium patens TaxID=3218 RepID=A0A2K1KTK6_PHYPA|nr:hypothetical protein PHYPA_004105 [Physcomitrium patens]
MIVLPKQARKAIQHHGACSIGHHSGVASGSQVKRLSHSLNWSPAISQSVPGSHLPQCSGPQQHPRLSTGARGPTLLPVAAAKPTAESQSNSVEPVIPL